MGEATGGGFTTFDIVAVVIVLLSVLIAIARGFVREALTVAVFVAAALGALWARPVFAELLADMIGSALLANIIALSAVFVVIYLALSFVIASLGLARRGDPVSGFDRALGLVFGVARGVVLLGLVVLVYENTVRDSQAGWMRDAQAYPMARSAADLLQGLAPEGSWAQSGAESEAPSDDRSPDENPDPEPDLDAEALDRLIRSTSEDEPG